MNIDAVTFTKLPRIQTPQGEVRHGLKSTDSTFRGFGEAYFSIVHSGKVKGWKKHLRATLNLVAVVGVVRFAVVSVTGEVRFFTLSPDLPDAYGRLTVPPGLWAAFGCIGPTDGMLMNVSSIPHDPEEALTAELSAFPWEWT